MADLIGTRLGNYRLVKKLGGGGFAEVFLGEHVYLDTLAAVKILKAPVTDEDTPDFLKEARTIVALEHPHIIPILDCGVENHVPFLIMKYASGGSMRQRYPKGTRLQIKEIVDYVKQISSALQYAHDHKFIHRDIKPENMLLGSQEELFLADFGIALLAQTTQTTQDVIGTWAYMAPEQFSGKPTRASDQYSLGIVVYEWLCGERPFRGASHEIHSQHLYTKPPSLRQKVPDLSLNIERVVMKALSKQLEGRFENVQAFSDALEAAYKQQLVVIENPLSPSSQLEKNKQDVLPSVEPEKQPVGATRARASNAQPKQEILAKSPVLNSTDKANLNKKEIENEEQFTVSYAIGKLNDFLEWFVWTLEIALLFRFLFKLIGANPNNLFAGFLYALTDIVLYAFSATVSSTSIYTNQVFEWFTLVGMIVYWLLFWAIRRFLEILVSPPDE